MNFHKKSKLESSYFDPALKLGNFLKESKQFTDVARRQNANFSAFWDSTAGFFEAPTLDQGLGRDFCHHNQCK